MSVIVKEFYDPKTSTLSYVVFNENKDAIVIDPILDYDGASSKYSTESVDQIKKYLKEQNLELHFVVETHVHADHLSGGQFLKKEFSSTKIGIGKGIKSVQSTFKEIYNFNDLPVDGSQFDFLLEDEQTYQGGKLEIKAIATPGHTPSDMCYLIGDNLFVGDSIFMPDMGTGRCDFPNGNAKELYHSIKNKIYSLPDKTNIFVGHDYQPGGRELAFQTTVEEQKEKNIHLKLKTNEKDFITFREERDRQLSAPNLLLPSLQFNIRAGRFAEPEENGVSYLKIPVGRA